ncbi:hypothetical protein GF357_04340 [Candidatus Dojkabacteria bacterium]|nr:hypothetical protein [Candidatus Dojkabacteria bacterium]
MLLVIAAFVAAACHFLLSIIDGLGSIELCYNNLGVSFGLLSGADQWLIVTVSAFFLVILVIQAFRESEEKFRYAILGICIASAGNLIDRVMGGGVCDYIRLPFLPISNFNDWVITLYLGYYLVLTVKDINQC